MTLRRHRQIYVVVLTMTCLILWAVSPRIGSSAPSKVQLDQQIARTKAKVQYRQSKERVLTRDISEYSDRVATLRRRLASLSRRQGQLQSSLARQRTQLNATQGKLRAERTRLARLQRRLRDVRAVLSKRLVRQYKNGRVDLATAVIAADGFTQALERGEYLTRLAQEDRKVIGIVQSARREARAAERQLGTLARQQRTLAAAMTSRRDAVAAVRRNVATVTSGAQAAASGKRELLRLVKSKRKDLEEDLAAMQAQQAKIRSTLSDAKPLAPARPSSGRFLWPINGTITSPFCERRSYEACHPGLDIAAPTGTQIRAPQGGRVAIASMVGGYGNYTCLQHGASLSSCYGHQSKLLVSVGQEVTRGQVIGLVGSTGRSTGPHLHFEVRINGTVTNPMNYL